jgi:hypothetical protein
VFDSDLLRLPKNTNIGRKSNKGFTYTIPDNFHPNFFIEHVEVSVSAYFPGGRGGASIVLTSPSGTFHATIIFIISLYYYI